MSRVAGKIAVATAIRYCISADCGSGRVWHRHRTHRFAHRDRCRKAQHERGGCDTYRSAAVCGSRRPRPLPHRTALPHRVGAAARTTMPRNATPRTRHLPVPRNCASLRFCAARMGTVLRAACCIALVAKGTTIRCLVHLGFHPAKPVRGHVGLIQCFPKFTGGIMRTPNLLGCSDAVHVFSFPPAL